MKKFLEYLKKFGAFLGLFALICAYFGALVGVFAIVWPASWIVALAFLVCIGFGAPAAWGVGSWLFKYIMGL